MPKSKPWKHNYMKLLLLLLLLLGGHVSVTVVREL
ncbi:unnamed protein product, partial [Cuscuta epithymum]